MNTVIACGGTGGHLFPGLAVAEVLRARGHEVMLFVSEKEIDSLAMTGREEFRFEKLPRVGFPSPFSPRIFGFFGRFAESLRLCRGIYRRFKPHAVLGMGGFTSTAPVLAGKMRGVPTFIHESNAIPGKANRLTARMVRAVLLGFKECAAFFPNAPTEVTGTPIRQELQPMDRKLAREKLGLREDLTTLLVMGGSQGASGINQAVIKSLPFLHDLPIQVIHLAGARDERLVADNYQREKIPAHVAAFSLPAILIPFPYAAEDHQTKNAEILVRAGAALLLKESDLTAESLAHKIRELIENPNELRRFAEVSARLAPKNAAALVVETMERYTQSNHDARL